MLTVRTCCYYYSLIILFAHGSNTGRRYLETCVHNIITGCISTSRAPCVSATTPGKRTYYILHLWDLTYYESEAFEVHVAASNYFAILAYTSKACFKTNFDPAKLILDWSGRKAPYFSGFR